MKINILKSIFTPTFIREVVPDELPSQTSEFELGRAFGKDVLQQEMGEVWNDSIKIANNFSKVSKNIKKEGEQSGTSCD